MTMQEKMTERYPVDERISQVSEKRLAVCGAIAMMYAAVRIIYVGFRGELAVPELVLLFLMVGAMALIDRKNDVYELPRFFGRPLDPKPSARGKRCGVYLLAAAGLAGSWAAADYFCNVFHWGTPETGILADFAVCTVIFFLIDFVWGEHKVKQYNKYQAKLEAEENDLS